MVPPVDRRIVLLGHQQLTVGAVERISKAIAIEVNEGPAVRAADVQVGEDHLVDAVIVPFVVGRHLIDPTRHAAVGIARRAFVIDHLLSPGRSFGFQVEGLPEP